MHRFIVRIVDRGALPLRQLGWVIVASLSTSCSASISLTLMCALYRSAEKSAAALKRNRAERCPNQATPCLGRGVGGPCNGRNVSDGIVPRRPLRSDTVIDSKFLWPPERLNAAPNGKRGVRTGWPLVPLRTYSYISLPVSLVSRAIYFGCQPSNRFASDFSSLSSGRRVCVVPYHNQRLGRSGL